MMAPSSGSATARDSGGEAGGEAAGAASGSAHASGAGRSVLSQKARRAAPSDAACHATYASYVRSGGARGASRAWAKSRRTTAADAPSKAMWCTTRRSAPGSEDSAGGRPTGGQVEGSRALGGGVAADDDVGRGVEALVRAAVGGDVEGGTQRLVPGDDALVGAARRGVAPVGQREKERYVVALRTRGAHREHLQLAGRERDGAAGVLGDGREAWRVVRRALAEVA